MHGTWIEMMSDEGQNRTQGEGAGGAGDRPDTPSDARSEPAHRRLKIGSLREPKGEKPPAEAKPAPSRPPEAVPAARPEPPPRPRRREQLTTELEQQMEEALADVSLDALMNDPTAAEPQEQLEPGTHVNARVAAIRHDDVFVEWPGRNQGVLPLKQLEETPPIGTQLDLLVRNFDAEEGLYELSLPGAAVDVQDWDSIAEGQVVEVMVTGSNKGGLECRVGGLRGFMPISQVSTFRIDDLSEYVDQKLLCVVTEANPERRNLVLSRRDMIEREQAEAKRKLWDELQVGQLCDGIVRSVQPFGAFVDLGGIDGLIHVSQLSWERVAHANEVVEPGQKVRVRIVSIDRDAGRISLAYRDQADNPWNHVTAKYGVSTRVKGTVAKIMEFGALVRLEPGVSGLVHISELSHKRVARVSNEVKEGQQVEALVLSVDAQAQRISLSIKALQSTLDEEAREEELSAEEPSAGEKKPAPVDRGQLKGGLDRGSGGADVGLKW